MIVGGPREPTWEFREGAHPVSASRRGQEDKKKEKQILILFLHVFRPKVERAHHTWKAPRASHPPTIANDTWINIVFQYIDNYFPMSLVVLSQCIGRYYSNVLGNTTPMFY